MNMDIEIELGEKVPSVEYKVRHGVYVIIIDDKKEVAIIRTPRAHFLPGGGLEMGESLEQCIAREMLEETGYEVKLNDYLGCAAAYEFSPRIQIYVKGIGYFFKGQLGNKVCEKVEADHELVWMKLEEAAEKLVLPHQAWALEKAASESQEKLPD